MPQTFTPLFASVFVHTHIIRRVNVQPWNIMQLMHLLIWGGGILPKVNYDQEEEKDLNKNILSILCNFTRSLYWHVVSFCRFFKYIFLNPFFISECQFTTKVRVLTINDWDGLDMYLRRYSDHVCKRMLRLALTGKRFSGRPKRKFMDKEEMRVVVLKEENAGEVRWSWMIHYGGNSREQPKDKEVVSKCFMWRQM